MTNINELKETLTRTAYSVENLQNSLEAESKALQSYTQEALSHLEAVTKALEDDMDITKARFIHEMNIAMQALASNLAKRLETLERLSGTEESHGAHIASQLR